MKKILIKCTVFTLLAVSCMSSMAFANDTSNDNQKIKEITAQSKKDAQKLIDNWDKLKVVSTPDAIAEAKGISKDNISSKLTSKSSVSVGSMGDILVTPVDLIGQLTGAGYLTGHAGIVDSNSDYTIESFPDDGVQRRTNDWKTRYAKALCARVPDGDANAAVQTARNQIGKAYNYNYFDKNRTDKFYCSQLVWRAYMDQNIDLDCNGGNVVAPVDLVSDRVEIIWKNNY